VLLFILVVTYATATAGIAAWLVPAGYSEDKAQVYQRIFWSGSFTAAI
jgi:hypothetical protein